MASIEVNAATVEYPIYNSRSMSLRNHIISVGTGGRLMPATTSGIVTVRALDNVSFSLTSGDRVGLVGHNGSGKSTLLKTLAGIYSPTAGSVIVKGRVSSILQLGAGLDFELSGYENVVRMGMLIGASKKQAQSFIPDIEEFTELGPFLSMPVHTYSAGMLTRLTFGVATAIEPDILLIDEVIGAGDAAFQEKAKLRIENVIKSASILILASHAPTMITHYCNRMFRFEQGRLIEDRKLPA